MAPSPLPIHILIIGGGIAGFAAAVGIRRKGFAVTVLERTPDLQTFGGSLLIPPNAGRVLDDYGILEAFAKADDRTDSHMIYRHDGRLLDIVDHLGVKKMYEYTYVLSYHYVLSVGFSAEADFGK
jgi:salicylate hydroxylase